MIKHYLLFAVLLLSMQVIAQTGIGTTSPNASAKLDVFSETKGFLPPRVALTSTSVFSPITGLSDASALLTAAGLLVYNTATAGSAPSNVTPGYYYWNGTSWIRLIVPTDNASNVTGTVAVANGGTGTTTGSITGTGALTFTAGGTNQNINLTPSGSGNVVINNRVGIGTNSPGATLEIGSSNGSVPGSLVLNPTTTGTGVEGAEINLRPAPNPTTPTAQTWVIDQVSNANNPRLRFFPGTTGETRGFTISDNGNFGIGTATPSSKLNIEGGGIKIATGFNNSGTRPALNSTTIGAYEIRGVGSGGSGTSQNDGADDGFLRLSTGGGTNTSAQSSIDLSGFSTQGDMDKNIVMRTAGTERLRITNAGRLGIGTSSPIANLHVQSSDHTSVYIESTTTDNYGLIRLNANTGQNWTDNWHELIVFEKQGSQIGKIIGSSNGTAVAYGTNSDYRLKKEFQDFNALDIVSRLKAYDYAWKLDNSRMYGFIAHELQNELPYAVSGKKDQVDKNGNIQPQTVDYGRLTPILLKAIQEQEFKINEQQKQIDALLKRLEILESKK